MNTIILDFLMINFLLIYIIVVDKMRKFIVKMSETKEKDIKLQNFIKSLIGILVVLCVFICVMNLKLKDEFNYIYSEVSAIFLLASIVKYINYVKTLSLRDYVFVSGRKQRAIGGTQVAAAFLIILFIFKDKIDIFMMF